MKYKEYGIDKDQVIILLHGGGLSWWNYREVAEKLQNYYHVILPILDGHAGSDSDFTTIESNATEIVNFIDENLGGSVLLIGGLSLGGQILLEILSQRKNICQYALVESALIIPSKLMHFLIKPAFGSCYGLIQHEWFSKLQFKSLRMKQELFDDYFRDTCAITKPNLIAFLQANAMYAIKNSIASSSSEIYVFAGEMENRKIISSAHTIQKKLSVCFMKILPKMYHGEFSMNHAAEYANTVMKITSNN
ncbi:MAG: alpha/beta hydrolase [Lachnospiraceae bacterium]|nr:alpha/beta hydrolase [Lachnospiraceae bacterium]